MGSAGGEGTRIWGRRETDLPFTFAFSTEGRVEPVWKWREREPTQTKQSLTLSLNEPEA
jgi:hypothetical protein